MPTNREEIQSKGGESIEVGDHVYTKIRGGRHEGDVSAGTTCNSTFSCMN